jgi:hypothetical protein
MEREVLIESECVVENLNFPRCLDHAWLFIAAGIHERLYRRTVDDRYVPRIIEQIQQSDEREFELAIDGRYLWSDRAPILASEVASALQRGMAIGLFDAVDIDSNNRVKVLAASDTVVNPELLASPLFTLTPSCRANSGTLATCGPYTLTSCSDNQRVMMFERRSVVAATECAAKRIRVVVTKNRHEGLRLLRSGHLTLSCPLGADPKEFRHWEPANTIINRPTNLAVILRPYTHCWLAHDPYTFWLVGRVLKRAILAEVTKDTFIPLLNFSSLFHSGSAVDVDSLPRDESCDHAIDVEYVRSSDQAPWKYDTQIFNRTGNSQKK